MTRANGRKGGGGHHDKSRRSRPAEMGITRDCSSGGDDVVVVVDNGGPLHTEVDIAEVAPPFARGRTFTLRARSRR